jgi:hypothetical protein
MRLPPPRGPLTASLFPALLGDTALAVDGLAALVRDAGPADLADDDFHLALWCVYQLHYSGFEDVDDGWEWEPELLAVRRVMETRFEAELRSRTSSLVNAALDDDGDVGDRLFAMTERFDGPSVAAHLRRDATVEQLLDFMVHRSIYNLRESDPQAFTLPRLGGAAKVALAEILYDEFGAGRPERLHSALFADAMSGCGLDAEFGSYVPDVSGATLAVTNAMNLFALHRTHVAAALGHFGAFEATSSEPSRHLVAAVDRLQLPDAVRAYFAEHVEADAVHEQVMFRTVCGGLAAVRPDLVPDLFFGAATCLVTEAAAGAELMDAWTGGRSGRPGGLDDERVA